MKKLTTFGLGVVAGLAAIAAAPAAYAEDVQFFPMLVYRTGPPMPRTASRPPTACETSTC